LPKDKEIQLSEGKCIKFDRLLIAVGAKPITPKEIKGLDLEGVHVVGTLESALEIISHINKGVNQAVVIGGGFMGIEIANMLNIRGIKVTIVEKLPHILSRMIDSDMSEKVAEILKEHGIKLVLNNTVKSVNGKTAVKGVTLDKKRLTCDMVVLAIGVAPNVELVKGSGIKFNHGIIVDSKMQTNKKDIFAAGDIAEVREQIEGKQGSFAIWPNAIEQGRIAGLNIAGKNIKYDGAEVVNVLDVFDIPIVAMGRTSHMIGKCNVLSRFTPQASKKILIKNNKIVGLQFIGTIRNTGTFYSLMKKGSDVKDISDRLLDENFMINPEVISSEIIS
jgi:NADPH-dependent 2,4-dienoyl-CoA reductase/sulfur reductase-like enzyme